VEKKDLVIYHKGLGCFKLFKGFFMGYEKEEKVGMERDFSSPLATATRKDQHIEINLREKVGSALSSGFEEIQFSHEALPDLDYLEIDTRLQFLGQTLQAPFLISGMTGGTAKAQILNERFARAAHHFGWGMALGSMRILLEDESVLPTFQVRSFMPSQPLLANLGAVQLNEGVSFSDCQRLVDLVQADALVLHLNPLQEILQPEGNKNWRGLLPKIGKLVRFLSVPVIVKEVGYGLSESLVRALFDEGVTIIDVAGAGGTSWSQVESFRQSTSFSSRLAESFRGWGIPTLQAIGMAKRGAPEALIIASGGIQSGIDGAKALHLGATLCGVAGPFLRAASVSQEALFGEMSLFLSQLKIAMMCTNSRTLDDLSSATLVSKSIF
jgi:isopentenyl-diphosphate delta-isomerase